MNIQHIYMCTIVSHSVLNLLDYSVEHTCETVSPLAGLELQCLECLTDEQLSPHYLGQ